jgi:hypothetical protein
MAAATHKKQTRLLNPAMACILKRLKKLRVAQLELKGTLEPKWLRKSWRGLLAMLSSTGLGIL